MKKWEKKSDGCKTIEDVVLRNTGYVSYYDFDCSGKPYDINKLDVAAGIIASAIKNGEPIYIRGDYDADGICATAILVLFFNAINCPVDIHLPHRFTEGFGLSQKMIDDIPDGKGLVITVDNGVAAVEPIKRAKEKGLTVIVTDHHLPCEDGTLPPADVIIDPNAIPHSATFNGYCGAGLSYKLTLKLIKEYYPGLMKPLFAKIQGLACIATVADVMCLVEDNRRIVKNGLDCLVTQEGRTSGMYALLRACNMDEHICAKDIGFKIAPCLNAAGRLFDDGAMKSLKLLTFDGDMEIAESMAKELLEINDDRKEKKISGLIELKRYIDKNEMSNDSPLCIYLPGLHEGLIGIYAGSLAEDFGVPCLVFTDSSNPDVLKGSGRTSGEINLKQLLDSCGDVFERYGGHAGAAGMSVKKEKFAEMKKRLAENVPPKPATEDVQYYDLELSIEDIPKTLAELERFAPFGEGNPEIIFKIDDFQLSPTSDGFFKLMGENLQHIKFSGRDVDAIYFDGTAQYFEDCFKNVSALSPSIGRLRAGEPPIDVMLDFQKYLKENKNFIFILRLNLLGSLSVNFFKGKCRPQIESYAFADASAKKELTPAAALLAKMAQERYRKEM